MAEDVVIIGAGIVGCATAYFLAREGASVTVMDPAGIAGGASGRNNGLIEHPYDAVTAGLFDETVALLHEALGEAMPARPVGTLLVAESEQDARGLIAHYSRFPELQPQLLTPEDARASEPLLAPDLWGCMLDTGYPISPAEATRAVGDLARGAGVRFVVTGTHGLRVGSSDGLRGGRLRTEGVENNVNVIFDSLGLERRRAGTVVVTAGAASAAVLEGFVRADIVTPLWGVIISVELPDRPRHPIIEGTVTRGLTTGTIENESPFTLLDSPSWLAVGSTLLEDEPEPSAWSRRLLDQGTRFVPSIEAAHVQGTLVCARPKSFDNRPILGRVPGQHRLWIGTGHGGRGMSLGAASGRLLADAILAGSDAAIPAEISSRRLAAD